MAKSKPVKRKKRNKPYPPLSRIDKLIYTIFSIVLIGAGYGVVYLYAYLLRKLPFTDAEVLACDYNWTIIFALPIFFIFIISIGEFMQKTEHCKRPIFGNKNVNYNDTKYEKVTPLFSKKPETKKSKFDIKFRITVRIFISVSVMFSVFLLFLSFFGRWSITDQSLTRYNCLNQAVEQYSYSDIVSYSVDSIYRSERSPGYLWVHYPDISVTVRLKNGKNISFTSEYIRNTEALGKIDSLITAPKTVGSDEYLESYIRYKKLGKEEIDILSRCFDTK